MKPIFSATICAAALFMAAACNQPSSDRGDDKLIDTARQASAALPDEHNVGKVITAYIALKDGLVKSDGEAGKKAAAELEDELADVKGCAEAANMARKIAATDNLDEQREAFLALSKEVITLAKGIKTNATTYVAYCPMANDNKGGYWLSDKEEIRNPYFGDAMLECGVVKEVIKN